MITNFKIFEKHNILPEYMYHLTSSEKYENIKKIGLIPKFSKQSKGEKGIYLTDDESVADNYANFYENGDELVLLKILTKGLNLNMFGPDDYELQDFLNDGGWGNKDKEINKFNNWKDVPWQLSLKWVNQVQYHDVITPENIEIIDKWIY